MRPLVREVPSPIDLFHISYINMIISLSDLVESKKFFCILHMLTRSERLIIIHIK